jgi:hypothetical protein
VCDWSPCKDPGRSYTLASARMTGIRYDAQQPGGRIASLYIPLRPSPERNLWVERFLVHLVFCFVESGASLCPVEVRVLLRITLRARAFPWGW